MFLILTLKAFGRTPRFSLFNPCLLILFFLCQTQYSRAQVTICPYESTVASPCGCSSVCADQGACANAGTGNCGTKKTVSHTVNIPINSDATITVVQTCGSIDASDSYAVDGENQGNSLPFSGCYSSLGSERSIQISLSANRADECISISVSIMNNGGVPGEGCNVPLPVELLHFLAKRRGPSVVLDWATASELNNEYFSVQYSRDGSVFEEIGRVPGQGHSVERVQYNFEHEFPELGHHYYRLKQIDYDGAYEYSDIVFVSTLSDKDISIRTHLVRENIILAVGSAFQREVPVEFYNVFGHKVLEAILPAKAFEQSIDVSQLQQGHYFVRINTYEKPKTLRFVKVQ